MNKFRNRYEWNKFLVLGVIGVGAIVSLFCIYVSFFLKFGGDIPARNFRAFEVSYLWILVGFIFINMLFETYVFYNKSLLDLFYFTMLSQFMLSVFMMALTYAGSWLTFPRSVILVNFFVGTAGIYIYNSIVYLLYHRIRGKKHVLVVGNQERALEAVRKDRKSVV